MPHFYQNMISMENLTSKLKLLDWAKEDRPREKLLSKGIDSLSDAELIAILIGSGNRTETAVHLAQRILQSANNSLNELGKYRIEQLIKHFKGIGEAKAITIAAALELGKRRKTSEIVDRKKITCSKDIYDLFHPMLCDLYYEEFWILLLNRSNKIIEKIRISKGGVSETIADPKLILREALHHCASGIILCHNHPSGNNSPSVSDNIITQKVKHSAEFFDIMVLDHIIVCDGSYYSYADEDKL